MSDGTKPPVRIYHSLPLEVELWLTQGLRNVNHDNSIDPLGLPWFDHKDVQVLLNRVYLSKLPVQKIDCGLMDRGMREHAWTISHEDHSDASKGPQHAASWFFNPFEEKVQKLKQDQLLDKAVFMCSVSVGRNYGNE